MDMVTKKINNSFFKQCREILGFTQSQLAEEIGISTRTVVAIENDNGVSSGIYNKIESYLLTQPEINGGYPEDTLVKDQLVAIENSHKVYGEVKSDFADLEKASAVENAPEIEFTSRVNVIQDDGTLEWQPVSTKDYLIIQRTAHPIETTKGDLDTFIKYCRMGNGIWIASTDISNSDYSSEGITALESLDKIIKTFDFKENSNSLSELNIVIKKQAQLIDMYVKLIDSGYHILLGKQKLHFDDIPIFFIEEFCTKKISYSVESVHPKYFNFKEIPYYSLTGGWSGLKNHGLALEETPYILKQSILEVDPFGNEPIEYPRGEQEKDWCKLSDECLKKFSTIERIKYDQLINKMITSDVDINFYKDLNNKIKSCPF